MSIKADSDWTQPVEPTGGPDTSKGQPSQLRRVNDSYIPIGPTAFGGNPNATITAINTSGGIVASRTSGQLPAFVQVSASAITATGTSIPYEDLEYSWDFGDSSGTETFTRPINSSGNKYEPNTVNANNSQTGPEAAYVYRTAGNKTITLNIRGKNGGSFTTAQVTRNFTATAFVAASEFWFAPQTGVNGAAGTLANPKKNISELNTIIASGANNLRIHVKRGEGWTENVMINLGAGAPTVFRLDAYGSGANPYTTINAAGVDAGFHGNNGGSRAYSDVVISNFDININSGASGTATGISIIGANSTTNNLSNIYYDNCNVTVTTNGVLLDSRFECASINSSSEGLGPTLNNFGMWGGSLTTPVGVNSNIGSNCKLNGDNWGFVVGLTISGGGKSDITEHHIYPSVQTHVLYRYITFGTSGGGKNFCINTNYDNLPLSNPALKYAEFLTIADCDMTGVLRAWDAGSGTVDYARQRFRNFVAQRNAVHGLTGSNLTAWDEVETITVRDNLWWGNIPGTLIAPSSTSVSGCRVKAYRNLVYQSGIGAFSAFIDMTTAGTFTQPQEFTYNFAYSADAAAALMMVKFADMTAAGSVINNNQYYAPNDSDGQFLHDNITPRTFAQWQAAGWDVNGVVADPGWNNPAAGDFS